MTEPDHQAAALSADRSTEAGLATLLMVGVTVLGVPLGLLWEWVTPGAGITVTREGPVHADPGSEHYFGDDGWFAVIGGTTGAMLALICWLAIRRYRGPLIMFGLVAGCLLGAVVAWQVGRHLNLAEFRDVLDSADTGTEFRRPAKLTALGVLGLQGFAAAFTYTLLAGWSPYGDLGRSAAREEAVPVLVPARQPESGAGTSGTSAEPSPNSTGSERPEDPAGPPERWRGTA